MKKLNKILPLLLLSLLFVTNGCNSVNKDTPKNDLSYTTFSSINGHLYLSNHKDYLLMIKSQDVTYYMNINNLAPIDYTQLIGKRVIAQGRLVNVKHSRMQFSPNVIFLEP